MIHQDHEKPRASRLELWFDTAMEISIGILPLVLVVMGIGMMSFSPRQSSKPLFANQSEARAYYKGIGMEFSTQVPIVLTSNSCASCDTFQSSLRDLGLSFTASNIDTNPGAASLYAVTQAHGASTNLPQVILGDQLVNPAPYSVRVAVRQAGAR